MDFKCHLRVADGIYLDIAEEAKKGKLDITFGMLDLFSCCHQSLEMTAKPCLYFSELKENFLPLEDSKAIYNPERDEAVIKDLHLNRLLTTYQLSYCANVGKKSIVTDPDNLDSDQFMVYFNNYYAKRTQPVPRPLYTGRRVFGYSRFDDYYTGRTTYQDIIGRAAYDYFKKDYDEGKSRLFRKKQQEKHRKQKAGNREEKKQEKLTNPEPKPELKSDEKEKICGLCCEKFGDFSFDALPCEQNEKKDSKMELSL